MSLSLARLLLGDESVPAEARTAIAEGRLADAGRILMETFGLRCEEATELVDHMVCPEPPG